MSDEPFFESSAYKALIAESTRLRAAATEYHATKAILTDLIAELRNEEPFCNCKCCQLLHRSLDRAEARIKSNKKGTEQ